MSELYTTLPSGALALKSGATLILAHLWSYPYLTVFPYTIANTRLVNEELVDRILAGHSNNYLEPSTPVFIVQTQTPFKLSPAPEIDADVHRTDSTTIASDPAASAPLTSEPVSAMYLSSHTDTTTVASSITAPTILSTNLAPPPLTPSASSHPLPISSSIPLFSASVLSTSSGPQYPNLVIQDWIPLSKKFPSFSPTVTVRPYFGLVDLPKRDNVVQIMSS